MSHFAHATSYENGYGSTGSNSRDGLLKDADRIMSITAAAEVGRTGQEASDRATTSLDWEMPTAADPAMRDFIKGTPLSEPNDGWAAEAAGEVIRSARERYLIYATIERCAQVANEIANNMTIRASEKPAKIIAAIRALKDS